MDKIIYWIIKVVHILYLLFVIVSPFTKNILLLSLHFMMVPFMMFHWLINNNTCALTLMEQQLKSKIYGTKVDPYDCITGKLINPIYDFKKNFATYSTAIYTITTILWCITCFKLYNLYKSAGSIKKLLEQNI